MFSLLLAYAMAVPAPEPTPEAAPEADPAVLASSSFIKAPVVVYHAPYYYYPYHYLGKRSAEPQPMDRFEADPRFARHMPSPYMRSRYV